MMQFSSNRARVRHAAPSGFIVGCFVLRPRREHLLRLRIYGGLPPFLRLRIGARHYLATANIPGATRAQRQAACRHGECPPEWPAPGETVRAAMHTLARRFSRGAARGRGATRGRQLMHAPRLCGGPPLLEGNVGPRA